MVTPVKVWYSVAHMVFWSLVVLCFWVEIVAVQDTMTRCMEG